MFHFFTLTLSVGNYTWELSSHSRKTQMYLGHYDISCEICLNTTKLGPEWKIDSVFLLVAILENYVQL